MIISSESKFSLSCSKETINIRNIEIQDTKIQQNIGMEIEDKDNFMWTHTHKCVDTYTKWNHSDFDVDNTELR